MRVKRMLLLIVMFSALLMGCVEESDTHSQPTEAVADHSENRPAELSASSIDKRVEKMSEISTGLVEGQPVETNVLIEEITEPIRFAPLGDNDRFAYAIQTVRNDAGRGVHKMTVYAARNNDIEDITELFSWMDVRYGEVIQFTSDFRKGFFLAIQRGENPHIWTHNLYMANGLTGEIRRLLTDTGSLLRASKDGRFVGFLGRGQVGESVNIFLFDIASETIVGEFEWRTEWPVSGGWDIFRFDNGFRIYGTWERGQIIAVAELDPDTMELRTLWDGTGSEIDVDWVHSILSNPTRADDDWNDDVVRQRRDPTIQLQR